VCAVRKEEEEEELEMKVMHMESRNSRKDMFISGFPKRLNSFSLSRSLFVLIEFKVFSLF
jgi:hypothetical protein